MTELIERQEPQTPDAISSLNNNVSTTSQDALIGESTGRISFDAQDILTEANMTKPSSERQKTASLEKVPTLSEIDLEDQKQDPSEDDENEEAVREESTSELSPWLVYYEDFEDNYGKGKKKSEVSVMHQEDFANDPEGYLYAVLEKYNVEHSLKIDDEMDDSFHPWIQGVLSKKLPNQGVFGRDRWASRLFRLYDEALVWFAEPTVLATLWQKAKNRWNAAKQKSSSSPRTSGSRSSGTLSETQESLSITPLGVLPLAMITSITATIPDENLSGTQKDEDELLTFSIEIGGEGSLVFRCEDWRQRIKWVQCLNAAVFNVGRPLFASRAGIWRLREEAPNDGVDEEMTKGRLIQMGHSLVLTIAELEEIEKEEQAAMSPKLMNRNSAGKSSSTRNTPRTSRVL